MKRKRKSRPGVCDRCGRAVPRFTYEVTQTGCVIHEPVTHIQGHAFAKGKLVRVGCRDHAPDLYPEYPRSGWGP